MKRKWIRRAIKKPNSLTVWVKRNKTKIRRITKTNPITRDGEISQLALLRLRKSKWYNSLSTKTKRRINLGITLEKMKKK